MNLNNIRLLLKKNGISQEKLAVKIGMSRTSLGEAIDRNDMKVSTLEKVAFELGVPISYFFDNQSESDSGIRQVASGKSIKQNVSFSDVETRVKVLEVENAGLRRELAAKDKIISLLESANKK